MSGSWYCHRRVWLKVVEVKEVTVLKVPDINATYDTAKILKKEEMNESIPQPQQSHSLHSQNPTCPAISGQDHQDSFLSSPYLSHLGTSPFENHKSGPATLL